MCNIPHPFPVTAVTLSDYLLHEEQLIEKVLHISTSAV